MRSCERLNKILKERYDIDLMANIDIEHINMVFGHYSEKMANRTLNESAQTSRDYLIMETARMILREIAPKRTKKKKKEYHE